MIVERNMVGKGKGVTIIRDGNNLRLPMKFMLLEIEDRVSSRGAAIVAMPMSTHPRHRDILGAVMDCAIDKGLLITPRGGGRISVDDTNRVIKACDACVTFGPTDRVQVESILRENFPGWQIQVSIPKMRL